MLIDDNDLTDDRHAEGDQHGVFHIHDGQEKRGCYHDKPHTCDRLRKRGAGYDNAGIDNITHGSVPGSMDRSAADDTLHYRATPRIIKRMMLRNMRPYPP